VTEFDEDFASEQAVSLRIKSTAEAVQYISLSRLFASDSDHAPGPVLARLILDGIYSPIHAHLARP